MENNINEQEKTTKKSSKPKTKKELSFEDALSRLEEIATILEGTSPCLSDALSLYEESAQLLKLCSAMLNDAEKKITVLEKDV